jgi:hypothetical protein
MGGIHLLLNDPLSEVAGDPGDPKTNKNLVLHEELEARVLDSLEQRH